MRTRGRGRNCGRGPRSVGVSAPRVLSAVVAANGGSMTLVFSSPVTGFGAGVGGLELLDSSLNNWIFFGSVSSGDGAATVVLVLDGGFPPITGKTLTLNYTPGTIVSTGGLPMAAFSGFPVTNLAV